MLIAQGPNSGHWGLSHPLAISAMVQIHNPSMFSMLSLKVLHGDLHIDTYNERLGRPNTTLASAIETASMSPRIGTFRIANGFAVPIGKSAWAPASASLLPLNEAEREAVSMLLGDLLHGKNATIVANVRLFDIDVSSPTQAGIGCLGLRRPADGRPAKDGPQYCDTHPATASFYNAAILQGAAIRLVHGTEVCGHALDRISFGERAHISIDVPRATAALLNPLDPYLLEQWIRPALNNPLNMTLIVTGMQGQIFSSNPGGPDSDRHQVGSITQRDLAANGIRPIQVPPFAVSYVPEVELPLNLNAFDVPILLQFLGALSTGGAWCDVEVTVFALVSGFPVHFPYIQRNLHVTLDGVPPSPPVSPPPHSEPPSPPPPRPPPEPSPPPPYEYPYSYDYSYEYSSHVNAEGDAL